MKSYVVGLALLVLIGTGGYYLVTKNGAGTPDTAAVTADGDSQAASANKATNSKAVTIVYTDTGFAPAALTVKLGSTVRFFNQSKEKLWVMVSPSKDPAKMLAEFDENGSILNGQGWEFTFTKTGTFDYQNYMSPKKMGSVTVTK